MKNVTLGCYGTESGDLAVVAQLKAMGMEWVFRGAVRAPSGTFYFHAWDLDGRSRVAPQFDLLPHREAAPATLAAL